jgi:hypothetical protein
MYLLLSNEYHMTIGKKDVFATSDCELPYFKDDSVEWQSTSYVTKCFELKKVFANTNELISYLENTKDEIVDGGWGTEGSKQLLLSLLQR